MLTYLGLRYVLRKLNLCHLIAPHTNDGAIKGVAISLTAIIISVLTFYSFMGLANFVVLIAMASVVMIYSIFLFINSIERLIFSPLT